LIVSENIPSSADDIADCLESLILCSTSSATGLGQLQEFAETVLQVGDASFTFAVNRMRNRKSVLGDSYPFQFDVASVIRTDDASISPYTQFLLMSGTALVQLDSGESSLSGPEQWFEELVLESMRSWLGVDSEGVRFGWPSDSGRPPEFPDAIRWLSSRMNVELGSAYRPPIRKDGGVDVVVWRPFGDLRSGFPIILVQCTLQKDLISKARDIDVTNWSGWLAMDQPPMTALATPRVVSESADKWNQLSRQTFVFERIRLSRCFPGFVQMEKHGKVLEATQRAFNALRERLDL
jgi:hypothetical protein